MKHQVEIYSDGACRGNPGPGGWGVLLRCGDQEKKLYGSQPQTTNNRMELQAAIEGLRALKTKCHVKLYTDSQYVQKGIQEWLPVWQKNGWRTSQREPVKNQDLWQALVEEVARHHVEWFWVKGHNNHPENEMADALANLAIDEASQQGKKHDE